MWMINAQNEEMWDFEHQHNVDCIKSARMNTFGKITIDVTEVRLLRLDSNAYI